MISRRRFLGSGSMLAAGAVVGTVASVGGLIPKSRVTEADGAPSRAKFESWIGSTFQVHLEALTVVPVQLAAVLDAPGRRSQPLRGHEQFSVLFHGPAKPLLPQQTYRMVHQDGRELTLFIVPVGCGAGAQTYEAVFHRPLTSA